MLLLWDLPAWMNLQFVIQVHPKAAGVGLGYGSVEGNQVSWLYYVKISQNVAEQYWFGINMFLIGTEGQIQKINLVNTVGLKWITCEWHQL